MARTGLLVVTNLSKIAHSLNAVKKYVSKTLYIQLYTGESCILPNNNGLKPANVFSKHIAQIYSTSLYTCQQLDVIVIVGNLKDNAHVHKANNITKPVDILLFDNSFSGDETNQFISRYNTNNVVKISKSDLEASTTVQKNADEPKLISCFALDSGYESLVGDTVVLGGTFDRLHCGHKLLLTEAVLRARKKIVVGVTDKSMVKAKLLHELILPVEKRIEDVREFLVDIDHTLVYEIVPIQDPFGPTKTEPDLDIIIVSSETLRGGEKVNEIRIQNNLKPLQVHCIDIIEFDTDEEGKEKKVSSSNQRLDLLGTRLQSPEPRPNLPSKPYIIGLIGGIASGKSVIALHFEKLGVKVINCDKLAHELYEPGTACHREIVSKFGDNILNSDDTINRKALGSIVFADKEKLNELNNIVWPALLKHVKNIIEEIRQTGSHRVVMLEAAVLLQAGWSNELHEIWSLIVPSERAIRRLIRRDNLTEEQAKQRIDAQPDNELIVKHSNVVMSTQWSYEFSQNQADKAWNGLMEYLKETGQL